MINNKEMLKLHNDFLKKVARINLSNIQVNVSLYMGEHYDLGIAILNHECTFCQTHTLFSFHRLEDEKKGLAELLEKIKQDRISVFK